MKECGIIFYMTTDNRPALAISGLSVVLPAYNEEAVIADTVLGVVQYGKARSLPLEIIVVNDGSKDSTREIVEKIRSQNPDVKLVNHEQNRGYGEALRSGFDTATKEWLFLMDSDGQFDIEKLDGYLLYCGE